MPQSRWKDELQCGAWSLYIPFFLSEDGWKQGNCKLRGKKRKQRKENFQNIIMMVVVVVAFFCYVLVRRWERMIVMRKGGGREWVGGKGEMMLI